jgi:hypothetical protein
MAQRASKSGQKGRSADTGGSTSGGGRSGSRSRSSRSGSSANGASAKPRSRTASSTRRTQSSRASSSGARKSAAGSRASGGRHSNAGRKSGGVKRQVENVRNALSSGAQSTRDTVAGGAQDAGQAIGTAANKAKGPAIAGGAAIAGLLGGMTIASRGGRRRVLGVPVPGTKRPLIKVTRPARVNATRDLMKAAGRMGNAGRQMAELATEVRLAREQMGGNGRRRSPVEVVLDGLTARRPR